MNATAGTLVYPSAAVLVQADGEGTPEAIRLAYRPSADTITVVGADGQEQQYTLDSNTIQSLSAGFVKFTDNSGTAYEIRPLDETDGQWLSRYHTDVPVSALRNMISGRKGTGTKMSKILQGQNETMVSFQFPDDDFLFGLLYINQFGSYIMSDGSWVMVPPNDDTFDDTIPFYVNPDTVDDFLAAWEQGPVTVADAETNNWITNPKEGRPTQTNASGPIDGYEAQPDDGYEEDLD